MSAKTFGTDAPLSNCNWPPKRKYAADLRVACLKSARLSKLVDLVEFVVFTIPLTFCVHQGDILKPRMTADGMHWTHTYEPVYPSQSALSRWIEDTMRSAALRTIGPETTTETSGMSSRALTAYQRFPWCSSDIAEFLISERLMPMKRPSRQWISFSDGLYDVQADHFYSFDDVAIPSDVVANSFMPFSFPVRKACLSPTDFFPHPPSLWDATTRELKLGEISEDELKTPVFDSVILNGFTCPDGKTLMMDDSCKKAMLTWLYALLGRLFYTSVCEDNWNVAPLLLKRESNSEDHEAETTLTCCQLIMILIDNLKSPYDQVELSAKKSAWRVEHIVHCDESFAVIRDIEQATSNTVFSDLATFIRRDESASLSEPDFFPLDMDVRLVLEGTTIPASWKSLTRFAHNLVIFNFQAGVDTIPTDMLRAVLTHEMGALVVKINLYYQHARVMMQRKNSMDVWKFLPEALHEQRRAFFPDHQRRKRKLTFIHNTHHPMHTLL